MDPDLKTLVVLEKNVNNCGKESLTPPYEARIFDGRLSTMRKSHLSLSTGGRPRPRPSFLLTKSNNKKFVSGG